MIQSVQRAIAIMRQFTEAEPELGVNELSRRLGLHKSTVSRLLGTLQAEGLVQQHPTTGQYSLGVGLVSLAGVALGRITVRSAAYAQLEALAQQTQETICLVAREDHSGVCIVHVPAPQPVRYVAWLGRRMPLHCTAGGKVLLAFGRGPHPPDPWLAYTPQTITNAARLSAELEAVRARGYALEQEEFTAGTTAVAAPVFDHQGQAVAAVLIAGPTFRLPDALIPTLLPRLHDATRAISARLGFAA